MSAEATTGLPLPEPSPKSGKHRRNPVVQVAENGVGQVAGLNGSMGIKGPWSTAANLTAMAVVAGGLIFFIYFFADTFKAQAQTFQENLRELRVEHAKDRVEHAKDRESIDELTRSVRLLVNEFRRARNAPPIEFEPGK